MSKTPTIVLILRVGGAIMLLAVFAVFMPTDLMDYFHNLLGLGPLPRSPITEYLTRSISIMYAMYGGMYLMIAANMPACKPLVNYAGVANLIFGVLMIGIDIYAGLPLHWILGEGPIIIVIGLVLLWFNREVKSPQASEP